MKLKQVLLIASTVTLVVTACSKDDDIAIVPPVLKKDSVVNAFTVRDTFGVYNVKEMPGIYSGDGSFALFSFDRAAFVGDSIAKTTKWDVAFSFTSLMSNWGGTAPDFWDSPSSDWAGNGSHVIGYCVKKDFNEVTSAPEDAAFPAFPDNIGYFRNADTKDTADANAIFRNIYNGETGTIDYVQPLNNHRTAIIKLNDGRYVKMEFTNIYKGNKLDPSKADFVYPNNNYLTFRYFIGKPGSKDLTTK
jgi:hypothetical protein